MIQRSYLIWYKHKSYFHTHWQLFLLQIHPYIIVWYILQIALVLFCHIISYVVKTNLWYQDLVKTSRPKLKILKFVHFAEIFQKIMITTFKLNFFKFLAFFQSVLVVSYLLIQQRKNSLNYSFTNPYPCNSQDNRLVTETCNLWEQDETWNLQDRDWDSQKWSQDQVSRLHHCK